MRSRTGCPKKHGNSVTNSISSLLWISIVISNFKSHNIIMSARVYFMKRVKDYKDVSYNISAGWTRKTDKFTLFVYCNFLVLLSTTVCSQNINIQNVNIADETLTDYSFLSIYHCTKSKNYLKRQYRIRHWIPMFIGTPCMLVGLSCFTEYNHMQWKHTHKFLTLATRLTRKVIQFSHKGRSTDSKTIEKDDL